MVEFLTTEPDIAVPADIKTLKHVLGVSPMEARFLQTMLKSKGWVGKEELPELKYSIRQVIYTLRMKLEPRNIWIVNDTAGRYSITPDSKVTLKAIIERALNSGE